MELKIIYNNGKHSYTEPTKEEKKQFRSDWE